jgi:putative DNA primase/helicase
MAADAIALAGRPRLATGPATAEVIERFRAALAARDIVPPESIIADGSIHRCDAAGKNGKGDAAYLLHLDGIPAGGLENWRDGKGWESWRFDIGRALTTAERDALRRKADAASARRTDEAARRHAAAREVAARIWHAARPAGDEHPYLARKGIAAHGLRVFKGALVAPIRDAASELHSLQFIGASGTKRLLKGGRVAGLYFLIGVPGKVICIAEGYATGASIHAATGYAVAVAFNAGNLGPVAGVIRENHPGGQIIVCADDDAGTEGNPGFTHARDAARATGALVAVPAFGADRPAGTTDFNDLHRARGLEAVRDSIAAAKAPAGGDVDTGGVAMARCMEWPEPEPLTEPLDAQPYPDEALPRILRDAVRQAQAFVQAPMALVACSALSALSLAAQGLANVRRDHQLVGPISLYLLAVADSGERKTTCDAIFCPALREWETGRRQEMSPEIAKLEAASAVFEAKKAGILEAIKHKRRRTQDTAGEERELEALVGHAPVPPLIPRLLYADATPEALAHALATGWPSGGVLSAEAGAVFGAHGMGQDTILRNLALLNVLWDGGEMAIDRRSKPSFVLRGRRLTFGLMVQPEALRGFLERAGTLPRGTGFIARFLIAWPGSTQGTRAYRPAPEAMPQVALFGERIRELLTQPLATDERGCLTPSVLDLSPQARAEWIRFHDEVERELGARGAFRGVRDVAAKAAENAARLAALFHVLEHGASGTIASEEIRAAACIVGWHLNEARRLLADLDTPPSLAAAIRLDAWLRNEAQANDTDRVQTKRIYQYGPNCVRDNRDLRAALAILAERGRARMEEDGRRRSVAINPALLDGRE